jgi:hypothetical protein
MSARGFWSLDRLSDVELVDGLRQLVRRSGWTEARIVAHLAELETRRLHSKAGRSLFVYCQAELGLSQNEAYYRIAAARVARKFPIVFELLERREIHLTAIVLIVDYISADNHVELLRQVSGKTKEQILCFLAARAPRPDAKNKLRRLPTGTHAVAVGPTGLLEPTSAERYRLQLNISVQLKQKLELLLDLSSHANPSRDLAVAVERAVDTEIERVKKLRFGQTTRPRRASIGREVQQRRAARTEMVDDDSDRTQEPKLNAKNGSRKRKHISNGVRREVLERDGLDCTFVSPNGQRCGARAFLQIDHDVPWAKGGDDSSRNLRLLCAEHNRLLAEQDFGQSHVACAIASNRCGAT